MRIAVYLGFLLIAVSAWGQPEDYWIKRYPQLSDVDLVTYTSTGYFVMLENASPEYPVYYLRLLWLQQDGTVVQSAETSNTGTFRAKAIAPTPDGGVIVAGTESSHEGLYTKFDQSGERVWTRRIQRIYGGAFYSVVATSDGLLLGGYYRASDGGPHQGWLVKTDEAGSIQWSQTYSIGQSTSIYKVVPMPNGEIILGGYTLFEEDDHSRIALLRVNAEGDSLRFDFYGRDSYNEFFDLIYTSDGGYLALNKFHSYEPVAYGIRLQKRDANDEIEWYHEYPTYYAGFSGSLSEEEDGGYIVASSHWVGPDSSNIGIDWWLFRVNENGDSLWSVTYGSESQDDLIYAKHLDDGTYALIGSMISICESRVSMLFAGTGIQGNGLLIEPGYVRFDDIPLSCTATRNIRIINRDIVSHELLLLDLPSEFSTTFDGPVTLAPADTLYFDLDFTPTEYSGYSTECLPLLTTDPADSFGIGVHTDKFSPLYCDPDLDFGMHRLDEPASISVEMGASDPYYIGQDTIIVDSITVIGDFETDFMGPQILTPDEWDTTRIVFNLVFAPTEVGYHSETLRVYHNFSCGVTEFHISGFGAPSGFVIPDSINFGYVSPGSNMTLPLTLHSEDPLDIAIFNVTRIDGSESFSVNFEGPLVLYSEGTLSLDVTFAPEALNYQWARFEIEHSGPLETVEFIVTGNGVSWLEDEANLIPDDYELLQNYPNPFNPLTTIRFGLPVSTDTRLAVCDINGRLVQTLHAGQIPAGYHSLEFDGSLLPSGIYFCTMHADGIMQTVKMALIK